MMKLNSIVDDNDIIVADTEEPRRMDERRRFERRYFEVPVRFMTSERQERLGKMVDISTGGLRISSDYIPMIGETIILYVDHIGRFEGEVVRRDDECFALVMKLSSAKNERLEAAIRRFLQTEAANAKKSDRRGEISDRRNHSRRTTGQSDEITAYTSDGLVFRCKIANLSLGGAEIITSAQLDLGQTVRIGTMLGRITRKTQLGYAIVRV